MLGKAADRIDRQNAYLEQETRNSKRHMLLLERQDQLLAQHTKALVQCIYIIKKKETELSAIRPLQDSGFVIDTPTPATSMYSPFLNSGEKNPERKIAYLEDLSFDVRNLREMLKTIAAKAQNMEYVTKIAGNRILIDGVSFGLKDMDLVPPDLKSAIPMIKRVKHGIAYRGKDCYLSNFFPVTVKIDEEEYNSAEQYFQYIKCLTCKDEDRATKVIASNDTLRIKSIGDGCKGNEEWLEIVYSL